MILIKSNSIINQLNNLIYLKIKNSFIYIIKYLLIDEN